MTFSDSDASRIISALDERLARRLGNNSMITSTWGEVSDIDASGKFCSVLLYGETDVQYKAGDFRIPDALVVTVGYNVKVSINNATGERWVDEASVPSAFKKIAIDPVAGTILTGDGTSAPSTPVGGGSGRNLLPNGGFLHWKNDWSIYQNGDTTAVWNLYTNSDPTWILRDGEVAGWDGVGGPYGMTAYIHSTDTGAHEPYIASDKVPCIAGEKYSLSALVGTHRTSGCYANIWFYDNTGANIGAGTVSTAVLPNDAGKPGGATMAPWRTLEIDGAVAPAGAQTMVVSIVMKTPYTSGSDCYLFIDQVMLSKTASAVEYQKPVEPGVPAGAIMIWPMSTSYPEGWALCNGQAISRTTYSDLFNTIGTTYGAGDGSTTFNVPNLIGRVPLGRNAEAIGTTGGASTHTHAGHSNHVVTQPSAHAALAHSGTAVSAHSGTAVADHSALAGHSHELPFTIDDTTAISSLDTGVFGTGTARTRDWTASVSGVSSSVAVAKSQSVSGGTPSAHSVTQPAAHTVTQPSDHASQSHSGTAVDGHSAHDSPSHMPPYMILNYIIKF